MDTGPKQRRKMNPRYTANLFSIITFGELTGEVPTQCENTDVFRYQGHQVDRVIKWWTLETFKLGYTRDIREDDLYKPLPEHQSNILGDAMQKAWDCELENSRAIGEDVKPSLWRVMMKVFGAELVLYGLILAAMEFLIRLQQPLFLGLLLRYYSPAQDLYNSTVDSTYFSRLFSYYDKESGVLWGEAVFFAFGVVFCSTANVMLAHPFMMGVTHIGMKMRVGVCSLIYRKSLKVSLQSVSESSAGLVVNLMANDVNRFDTGPSFIHYLWIGPLETMLMTVYLYREMGMPAVYGSLMVIGVVPFQVCLGIGTAFYRNQTALRSDERVKLMKEIVMGIEVIKMYTWEIPFRTIIDNVRRQEIRNIKMTSYIRGIIMSFIMFTARFSIFITVLLYVIYVNRITVENVFFLTCYYNIMRQTMTLFFPQAVGQIAEMHVAIQRIRDFLLSEECELPPREQLTGTGSQDEKPKKRVTISIEATEIMNVKPLPTKRLSEPSTSLGPARSKSEHTIKEEIVISFNNAFSRWLKSSDKEDVEDITFNIIPGSLTTIIGAVGSGKSTLLQMILSELPSSRGSVEVIGTVSYACQDPWLFVGSVRQNILFGLPFQKKRYMEVCKVCALERDISLFPHGDKTVIGERGVSLSGGQRARINLARAVYKEAEIYLLDDPLSAVDTHVSRHIFENCIKKYLSDKTVVLVTHQIQFIKSVDQIIIMDKGKILAEGCFEHLNERELAIIQLMQDKTREIREEESTLNLQSQSMLQPSTVSLNRRHWSVIMESSFADQKPEAETQAIGRVRGTVYKDYFLAGAPFFYFFIVCIMFIVSQFFASASDFWISKWSHIEEYLTGDPAIDDIIWSNSGLYRNHYVLIFGVLTIATVAVALFRALMFFSLCMKSSIRLHDEMFDCISHSPMSFYHTNPSGRILNRLSKDMGSVDELLPQAMLDCFQIILNLIGVIIVILMTDIAMLIPITTALLIFYIFRVVYVRTTSAIKRLEGITRSPVFSHVNATVLGLATIRSFGAEELLAQEFDRHQDLHSAAWYLFITCSRSFGYYLDVVCLLFIACVTFSCLMKTDNEGSNVGLVITQSISLTGVFQWGMRQSAEMENQMTSVERVLEYTKLPQEAALRCESSKKPPQEWPTEGAITFDDVSLRYSQDGNYVLHKLQFNVQPREKIGIVGRTGAGKSSIIQALFRLAYLDGTVTIDGIDISSIGLHDLREKISIIPQEPVLFSGTLRKNLDPFDEYPDELLVNALKHVELLNADDGVGALYKSVSECGANFSVGERQLVCLARAIARNERVLLMDEATANVDAQTDALIQAAIRVHFNTCTVLTVAHRLNTVIDSDKILVLDAGRLMEYDHPHLLLQNKKGYFRKMVAETGPAMAQMLHKLAKESYKKTKMED